MCGLLRVTNPCKQEYTGTYRKNKYWQYFFTKKLLGFFDFRFSLLAISNKMQMHEEPFFFELSILNIHTNKTVEQWQLAFYLSGWHIVLLKIFHTYWGTTTDCQYYLLTLQK